MDQPFYMRQLVSPWVSLLFIHSARKCYRVEDDRLDRIAGESRPVTFGLLRVPRLPTAIQDLPGRILKPT